MTETYSFSIATLMVKPKNQKELRRPMNLLVVKLFAIRWWNFFHDRAAIVFIQGIRNLVFMIWG